MATTPASTRGTTSTIWVNGSRNCGTSILRAWPLSVRVVTPVRLRLLRLRRMHAGTSIEREDSLRLRAGRSRGEGAPRAWRLRIGGRQVRLDERPDVGGPAPCVEA